jgi:hypothetical protein
VDYCVGTASEAPSESRMGRSGQGAWHAVPLPVNTDLPAPLCDLDGAEGVVIGAVFETADWYDDTERPDRCAACQALAPADTARPRR